MLFGAFSSAPLAAVAANRPISNFLSNEFFIILFRLSLSVILSSIALMPVIYLPWFVKWFLTKTGHRHIQHNDSNQKKTEFSNLSNLVFKFLV